MSNPILETAAGTIDGANDIFQTSEAYTATTVRVYVNGLLLQVSAFPKEGVVELGGKDFRVMPVPRVDDTLHVYYQTGPVSPSTAYPEPPQCYESFRLEPISHSGDNLEPLSYGAEEIVDVETRSPLPLWSDDLVPEGISMIDLVPEGVTTLAPTVTTSSYRIPFTSFARMGSIGAAIVDTGNLSCVDIGGMVFTYEAMKRDDGTQTYTIVDVAGELDATGEYIYVNDLGWCNKNSKGFAYFDLTELLYD